MRIDPCCLGKSFWWMHNKKEPSQLWARWAAFGGLGLLCKHLAFLGSMLTGTHVYVWLGVTFAIPVTVLRGKARCTGLLAFPPEISHFSSPYVWSFSGSHFLMLTSCSCCFPLFSLLFLTCYGVRNWITKLGRNECKVKLPGSKQICSKAFVFVCYFLVHNWIMQTWDW